MARKTPRRVWPKVAQELRKLRRDYNLGRYDWPPVNPVDRLRLEIIRVLGRELGVEEIALASALAGGWGKE